MVFIAQWRFGAVFWFSRPSNDDIINNPGIPFISKTTLTYSKHKKFRKIRFLVSYFPALDTAGFSSRPCFYFGTLSWADMLLSFTFNTQRTSGGFFFRLSSIEPLFIYLLLCILRIRPLFHRINCLSVFLTSLILREPEKRKKLFEETDIS